MKETTSDIRPLAREIARHFGQGWTMEEAPPDWGEQVRTRAYLVHEDGRRIMLLAHWGPGGKMHVCGDYGEDNGRRVYPKDVGAIRWDEEAPAINVSPHRGAEAVAKDIARRFLPRYTEVWTRCRETIEGRREYRRRAKENAERIAKAIGAAPDDVRAHEGGDAYTIYVRATDLQHGRIEVGGSYAEILVSVKDMDAAEKIARALRDNPEEARRQGERGGRP